MIVGKFILRVLIWTFAGAGAFSLVWFSQNAGPSDPLAKLWEFTAAGALAGASIGVLLGYGSVSKSTSPNERLALVGIAKLLTGLIIGCAGSWYYAYTLEKSDWLEAVARFERTVTKRSGGSNATYDVFAYPGGTAEKIRGKYFPGGRYSMGDTRAIYLAPDVPGRYSFSNRARHVEFVVAVVLALWLIISGATRIHRSDG